MNRPRPYASACPRTPSLAGGLIGLWQGRWIEALCLLAAGVFALSVVAMEHGAADNPWMEMAAGSGLLMAIALVALFARDVLLAR